MIHLPRETRRRLLRDAADKAVEVGMYETASIMDGDSCRAKDAVKIWNAIMVGHWTVGQVATAIGRGVRYTHEILRELEHELRVTLSDVKRVSDRRVTVCD